VGADAGNPRDVAPPARLHRLGVEPQRAAGRVLGLAVIDRARDQLAFVPGVEVDRPVAPAVAIPRELAAVALLDAALADDAADRGREGRVAEPVHHHVRDGELAERRLAAGFEIDVEGEAADFRLCRGLGPRRQGQGRQRQGRTGGCRRELAAIGGHRSPRCLASVE
jgi:hypothetical protein